MRQLFAVAGDEEQAVIDRQAETEQRDDDRRVLVDVGDVFKAQQCGHAGEDRQDRGEDRDAGRNDAAEDEDEHDESERQRQAFGQRTVVVDLVVDLIVHDRSAAEEHARVRCAGAQRAAERIELLRYGINRGVLRSIRQLVEGYGDEQAVPVAGEQLVCLRRRHPSVVRGGDRPYPRDVPERGRIGKDRTAGFGVGGVDAGHLAGDRRTDLALVVEHVGGPDGFQRVRARLVGEAIRHRSAGQESARGDREPDDEQKPSVPKARPSNRRDRTTGRGRCARCGRRACRRRFRCHEENPFSNS